MARVLVTGMSGTGKSSALAELGRRGFVVVDTDEEGWMEWSVEDGGYVWREDRIAELLARHEDGTLYISGTVSEPSRARQSAFSQPSSPSDHGTAVPRLKISPSSSSLVGHTPILSLSG